MTRHPAAPRHPFTDPADLRQELDDLHGMAREAGFPGPLRDTLAHLIRRARQADRGAAAASIAKSQAGAAVMWLTR